MIFSTTSFVLAASTITFTFGAFFTHSLAERDVSYEIYAGDGSMAQGWPAKSEWADFDTM
jgi:hypothetical protein